VQRNTQIDLIIEQLTGLLAEIRHNVITVHPHHQPRQDLLAQHTKSPGPMARGSLNQTHLATHPRHMSRLMTMVALRGQLSHLRPEASRIESVRSLQGEAVPRQHRGEAAGGPSSLPAGRPPQRRVTSDLLSDLIAGYEAGQTTYQLADKHGLNRNTVAAHLRSAGITIRMDGMMPDQIERAEEYYQKGWSLARVGREVGADAETVRKRLRTAV
jgi:hypothetical protein